MVICLRIVYIELTLKIRLFVSEELHINIIYMYFPLLSTFYWLVTY